jgi:hypothetical protein
MDSLLGRYHWQSLLYALMVLRKHGPQILLTSPGHVSLRRHRPRHSLRPPDAQSRGMGSSAILGLSSDRHIWSFTSRIISDMRMVCG